ncbi:histidinol-phosphate transaminase [Candidatus Kirkpatrickella diaphorinae]|uniref:Histidinol-phosphate aminotransferase n=1 Tax=Candidatus Kirkpatrickella diaphorinae TaxID=2984322 RepID=A0ABY6GG96_9PROT|nr:histidinol-phosphate transaminase [Candidatus Kirkpatrickella diaphorinae]UYH50512.1 histidinol-phosphate transaminase [Candidatus Kirkpatrickella diaphorinae]
MNRYWSPLVHKLDPYIPGEQSQEADLVKLNTNELPFPPSPAARDALRAACDDDLRLYPDPTAAALRKSIARLCGCELDNVFVGNGSDEVLGHAFRALMQEDRPILFADVTYGFYPVYCHLFGLTYQHIPLTDHFTINIDDYLERPAGGIVIANPNANTGLALPRREIERLVRARRDCVVLIDEAYVDFGAESAARLVSDHPNLIVVQTLSKSRGLAGLRVGFALAHPKLVEGLTRVKDSFNSYPLSRIAQSGAIAAIEDTVWLEETVHRIKQLREDLTHALEARGFTILPSQANFIAARHTNIRADELTRHLRKENILVRHMETQRIADWVRITIGSEAQHQRLLTALDRLLQTG